jgi:hypothetical protein
MMANKKRVIEPTNQDIVRSVFPKAAAKYFLVCHEWEVYETSRWQTAYVLGSGSTVETTFEQDEVDYKSTEEAAAKHVKSALQWLANAQAGDCIIVDHREFKKQHRTFSISAQRVGEKRFIRELTLAMRFGKAGNA